MKHLILAAGLLLGGCDGVENRRATTFDHCMEHSSDAYACAEAVDRLNPRPGKPK